MTRHRLLFAALALATLLVRAQTSENLTIKTAHLALDFYVGKDGRLYQRTVGGGRESGEQRDREAYPQAGDGYIWEPALQVVHADGNTSTDLHFDRVERTNDAAGQEITRIHLRDPMYPFNVSLCFRAYANNDLLEQWTEIQHHED
jgi:alpha-galactosidase